MVKVRSIVATTTLMVIAVEQHGNAVPVVPITAQKIATPMASARAYTNAISPRPGTTGEWNLITQHFNSSANSSAYAPIYTVYDLKNRQIQSTLTRPTFGYYGYNWNPTQYSHLDQVRAANGRIYFSEVNNWVTYYDPTSQTVKVLGQAPNMLDGNKFINKFAFDQSGNLFGVCTNVKKRPAALYQIDTTQDGPSAFKHLTNVGLPPINSYENWGLFIMAGDPWVYIVTRGDAYQLFAVNKNDPRPNLLLNDSNNIANIEKIHPLGIEANKAITMYVRYKGSSVDKKYYLADGRVYDAASTAFTPRNVKPFSNPVLNRPTLDTSSLNAVGGVATVKWTEVGQAQQTAQFHVPNALPINMESLISLANGKLYGDGIEYFGSFMINPFSTTVEKQVFPDHAPSVSKLAEVGGKIYLIGYPDTTLFCYDPGLPWTSTSSVELQPHTYTGTSPLNFVKLGQFAKDNARNAATRWPRSLIASPDNSRLYMAAYDYRERIGSGIGYYDLATKAVVGHHDGDLHSKYSRPVNMIAVTVNGGPDYRLIFSGETAGGTGAQLLTYDKELNLLSSDFLSPDKTTLANTGTIYPTPDGKVIGLISGKAMYLFNPGTHVLDDWIDETKVVTASTSSQPGVVWASLTARDASGVEGPAELYKITVQSTLQVQYVGTFPSGLKPGHLVWAQSGTNKKLLFGVGADLYEAGLPTLP